MNFNEFTEKLMVDMKKRFRDHDIQVKTVDKLQGQTYHGMIVQESGQDIQVVINLDQAYEQLQNGYSYRTILGNIDFSVWKQSEERPDFDAELLEHYEKMVDNLIMQVIPIAGNEGLLSKTPHRVTGDIATVYRFLIEKDLERVATVLITQELLEKYHVSPEQLHQDALEYAPKNDKPIIRSMAEMIMEATGISVPDNNDLVVATVESHTNGAAVINYPGFLEDAAKMLEGDFYVLPSSIHEVLLMKDDGSHDVQALNEMVTSINENEVDIADRLSNNAYHYDSKEKILELAVDFENRMKNDRAIEERETMNVLLIEPGEYPKEICIGCELEDLQSAVGGYIEATYPFDDPVALIMNDEGKLMGQPLNRALRDENGNVYDVVAGTFLVAGITEEDFGSLSPDLMTKYKDLFHRPEVFVQTGHGVITVPIPDEIVKKDGTKSQVKVVSHKSESRDSR